jgi:hypothetical protein
MSATTCASMLSLAIPMVSYVRYITEQETSLTIHRNLTLHVWISLAAVYLGGSKFSNQPRDWLSWLRFFPVFLGFFSQMLG